MKSDCHFPYHPDDTCSPHIPENYEVQIVRALFRHSQRGVVLSLEDPGQLSPGQLPEDAGTLVLELRIRPPSYEGNARWWLERGGDWEMAPAGTWVWD